MVEGARIINATPGVDNSVGLAGIGMLAGANASSVGTYFVALKPWKRTPDPGVQLPGARRDAQPSVSRAIPEASVMVVTPARRSGPGSFRRLPNGSAGPERRRYSVPR